MQEYQLGINGLISKDGGKACGDVDIAGYVSCVRGENGRSKGNPQLNHLNNSNSTDSTLPQSNNHQNVLATTSCFVAPYTHHNLPRFP